MRSAAVRPALTAAYETAAAEDPDVKAFGQIGQTGAPMPAIPESMGAVVGLGQRRAADHQG